MQRNSIMTTAKLFEPSNEANINFVLDYLKIGSTTRLSTISVHSRPTATTYHST